MKIVTNNIFQKDYEEALNILKPLIVLDDSLYIEKLLFLDYIANISLQDYEDAKISLLRLYLEFPQHSNRKEILAGLVDIYEHQEQYLLSWYMLNKLFSISNDAQKFKLQNDLDRIKRKICEDPTTEDQFKNFLPIFEIEKNIFKAESNK